MNRKRNKMKGERNKIKTLTNISLIYCRYGYSRLLLSKCLLLIKSYKF